MDYTQNEIDLILEENRSLKRELESIAPKLVRDLSIKNKEGDFKVDLWQPRLEGCPIRTVTVGLMDVRAADSIRISYDYERDGWKIEQATIFEWEVGDETCDEGWVETAFCLSWPFS